MSTNVAGTSGYNQTASNRQTLLKQIASTGARPFAQQVVQSPWNAIIDVESLHRDVKVKLRSMIDSCEKPEAIRCVTVTSLAGYGKTHLVAWTRQLLDNRNDAIFVFVPPYLPGSPGMGSLEQHVMSATIDSLWVRSHKQKEIFAQAVRSFLVTSYDRIVDSGHRIKETLRTGSFWSLLFRRSSLRIGNWGQQDQLAALQKAFSRRDFFDRAFADLASSRAGHGADGVCADRDTFVAACLLSCGDTRQRWHADRWLRSEHMPPDVLAPFHIDHPCHGAKKVCDGLYTLKLLANRLFCLAFDQMEGTYQALDQFGKSSKPGLQLGNMLNVLVNTLTRTPRFCLMFMFELSLWQEFARHAPSHLKDRMIEGNDAQQLFLLTDRTAEELIRERMEKAVWSQLPNDQQSPQSEPFFPFSADDIRTMRIDTGGELRAFLQTAQNGYEKFLQAPPRPRPMTLSQIDPQEVLSHEPTAVLICGKHLPIDVLVFFDDIQVSACRPADDQIEVTTPVGLLGDIKVRVQAAEDPENCAFLFLRFRERTPPEPYWQTMDGSKFKAKRIALGLTQRELTEKVQLEPTKAPYMAHVERGKPGAPADVYIRLAKFYGEDLRTFLK